MAIFSNPFFTEMLLPFLLVFVVVFAILQKSKILGDGKAQIDAIVGLVIGLILIGGILVGLRFGFLWRGGWCPYGPGPVEHCRCRPTDGSRECG